MIVHDMDHDMIATGGYYFVACISFLFDIPGCFIKVSRVIF
jgi:hypothetical protein